MKKINAFYYTGFLSIIFVVIFFLFGLISFLVGVFTENSLYFDYSNYQKKEIEISEITTSNCGRGGSFSIVGKSKKFKNLRIGRLNTWKRCEKKGNFIILDNYEKSKSMLVWVNYNSDKAYFFEKEMPKLSFFTIWKGDLIRLFFFILFFFSFKYIGKYFKKELSKYGLTTSEFHKLRKEGKINEYLKNYENNQN